MIHAVDTTFERITGPVYSFRRSHARQPSRSNPLSISRRIASEREGFGSGWRSIYASILASSSGGMRRPRIGWTPVGGRPRGLFCLSAIDPPLPFPLILSERRAQSRRGVEGRTPASATASS